MVATARVSAVAPSHSARASSSVTGDRQNAIPLDRILKGMSVEFREEPCRSALNRVQGMPFKWSLNPYMGCAHRCTFCYVRGFERRADRPAGEAYGRSVRVKVNVAEVLRRELARTSWKREVVAIGAATDPYQPAEGRYRLTRACLEVFADARSPGRRRHRRLVQRPVPAAGHARALHGAPRTRLAGAGAELSGALSPAVSRPRHD